MLQFNDTKIICKNEILERLSRELDTKIVDSVQVIERRFPEKPNVFIKFRKLSSIRLPERMTYMLKHIEENSKFIDEHFYKFIEDMISDSSYFNIITNPEKAFVQSVTLPVLDNKITFHFLLKSNLVIVNGKNIINADIIYIGNEPTYNKQIPKESLFDKDRLVISTHNAFDNDALDYVNILVDIILFNLGIGYSEDIQISTEDGHDEVVTVYSIERPFGELVINIINEVLAELINSNESGGKQIKMQECRRMILSAPGNGVIDVYQTDYIS